MNWPPGDPFGELLKSMYGPGSVKLDWSELFQDILKQATATHGNNSGFETSAIKDAFLAGEVKSIGSDAVALDATAEKRLHILQEGALVALLRDGGGAFKAYCREQVRSVKDPHVRAIINARLVETANILGMSEVVSFARARHGHGASSTKTKRER